MIYMPRRDVLTTPAPCPCGGWVHPRLRIAPGISADHEYCDRCKQESLVIRRGAVLIGSIYYQGRHESAIRAALHAINRQAKEQGKEPPISRREVFQLVEAAKEIAANLPPRGEG